MTDTTAAIRTHVEAVIALLLGNRRMKPGLAICGGDPLDHDEQIRLIRVASMAKSDVIHLEFDARADGTCTLAGITLVAPRGGACFVQTNCQLWLPEGKNRAVILPQPTSRGYFRALPGELLHVDGKPAVDPSEGIARAEAWVRRRMRANIPAAEIAGLYEIAEVQ